MKRAIIGVSSVVVILSLVAVSQAALVFQMDFNDADGNSSLLDRGTTGVTGSFTGNAAYSNNVPPVNSGGYSGSFDGASGAADFGDIAALDGLSAFTVTAWIRMNSAGENGAGRIFTKRSGSGPELYYHSADNELELVIDGAGTTVFNGGGAIAVEWVFMAVTWSGTTATFYTGDGTTLSAGDADTGTAQTLSGTSASLLIGNTAPDTRTFDGLIDNLRIYNTVENAASLTSIMQFDDTGYQSDFTGTTLASAGLAASPSAAGGGWAIDDANDQLDGTGGGNARGSVYTTDSWQSDDGFTLEVTFWGHSGLVRHSFGIVDANFNIAGTAADWLNQSLAGAYGIGFSTAGGGADGLYFNNDAGTLTQLSTAQGNKTSAAAETMTITVTPDSWSYSLNGASPTTGSHTFDTTRNYRFIAYAQRASRANFSNITLIPLQPVTWDGSTDTDWSGTVDTTSWTGATYNDGDPVNFDGAGSTVNITGVVSPGSISVNDGGTDYTFTDGGGSIAGETSLTKDGAGKLTINTTNTYKGTTTIDGGTLKIDGAGQLGIGSYAGNIAINNTSIFDYGSTADQTLSGIVSGTGVLVKDNTSTLTLTGANTYSGATTVSNGTLKLQGSSFSTQARAYSVDSGAILNLDGGASIAAGTSEISGDGTLLFTGGSLSAGGNGRDLTLSLGSGALIDIDAGGEIRNGGWQAINWNSNLADLTVDGTLDVWDGADVKVDALTGSGTITKGQALSDVILQVGVDSGSGTFSGTIGEGGGAGAFVIGLTKTGSGTQTLSGANTYTGDSTINNGGANFASGGQLQLANASGAAIQGNVIIGNNPGSNAGAVLLTAQPNQFGPDSGITMDNASSGYGYFMLNGNDQVIAGLSSIGTANRMTVENFEGAGGSGNDATLTISNSTDYSFGGQIRRTWSGPADTGDLNIIKKGTGTQTFYGANIFKQGSSASQAWSGNVIVSNGTLVLAANAFSTSPVDYSIGPNGVLQIDGAATIPSSTTTISGGGTLLVTGGQLQGGSGRNLTVSLGSDALIDIETGGKILNGGHQSINWDSNQADLTVDGTLDVWDGADVKVDALTGSGTVTKGQQFSDVILQLGVDNGSGTFSGSIGEGGGAGSTVIELTKSGSGTQTLSGANTYDGDTTVNAGTLLVNGSNAGSGAVTVNGTATLGGTGSISGLVTVNSTGHIAPGASIGTITMTSGLTLNNGSILDIEADAAGNADQILLTTGGTFTGATVADGVTLNVTFSGMPKQGAYTLIDWSDAGVSASGVDLADFDLVLTAPAEGIHELVIANEQLLLTVLTGTVFMFR